MGVHVRRTDYINWIQSRYKGRQVEASFFLHCIAEFLALFPDAVFLVELSTNLRDVLQFLLERFQIADGHCEFRKGSLAALYPGDQ